MPSRQHMLRLQKSSLWREWKGLKEREGYSKKESKEKERKNAKMK
jgi:hypothetical protein